MKTIEVQLKPDHLQRMTVVKKPILGLIELIWNGLDADATEVRVVFHHNRLGALDSIEVIDNGHGMTVSDAESAFAGLGGSWTRSAEKSRQRQRMLHGRAGKGRFRAFSLGGMVTWKTTATHASKNEEMSITGTRERLGRFELSDTKETKSQTGTVVVIANILKEFKSIEGPTAIQEITEEFAIYLREYSDVRIVYNGIYIDPASVEERITNYDLRALQTQEGKGVTSRLVVIEWKIQVERSLFLCDAKGFSLDRLPPGVHAPGYRFTAYLCSDFLRELDSDGLLALEEMNPDLGMLLEAAKAQLKEHFRKRAAEDTANLVDEWKREEIYPFKGKPANVVEEVERQVFDVVALNIENYVPDFSNSPKKNRQLSFGLLRQAIEQSPTAVRKILSEVLDLPQDKQSELAQILEKTSMAAIISASKLITDRLDFVAGLERIVFDPEIKDVLLERSQLHRILADHTWIFGEEFNLAVDDQSLSEVLAKHLHTLRKPVGEDKKVVRLDGSTAIVDLMLSQTIPQPRADEHEHLVVELKRPKQKVDQEVLTQIKSYAFAVAADERFTSTKTRWLFLAISNEITEEVRREASQRDRPLGLVIDDATNGIQVWVKTWSQVIDGAKARLRFFSDALQYKATGDAGLDLLRKTHAQYLPKEAFSA